MEFKVYILFSKTKNRYYIGFTSDDILKRIRKHNANHKGFTGGVGDWEIKYVEEYQSKETAYKREKEIKSWKSRIMIEKLVTKIQTEHPDF